MAVCIAWNCTGLLMLGCTEHGLSRPQWAVHFLRVPCFCPCSSSMMLCSTKSCCCLAPRENTTSLTWLCVVSGAIAEAGAQQSGDMMQDFKTAHLLGVSPRAQFFAMLLGSGASVFVSVAAYALYTAAWEVPGPELPAPTAMIWLDMASLVSERDCVPACTE